MSVCLARSGCPFSWVRDFLVWRQISATIPRNIMISIAKRKDGDTRQQPVLSKFLKTKIRRYKNSICGKCKTHAFSSGGFGRLVARKDQCLRSRRSSRRSRTFSRRSFTLFVFQAADLASQKTAARIVCFATAKPAGYAQHTWGCLRRFPDCSHVSDRMAMRLPPARQG